MPTKNGALALVFTVTFGYTVTFGCATLIRAAAASPSFSVASIRASAPPDNPKQPGNGSISFNRSASRR